MESAKILLSLSVLLCLGYATEARHVNLTKLDNCVESGRTAPVHLTSVTYELNPASGVIDVIHAQYSVKTPDLADNHLIMRLYKCPADFVGTCNLNPTIHEEPMPCERFVQDSTGPWHMFSSSMSGSKCGDEVGDFTLDYSSLKTENLIKYLDIHDDQYSRFHLEMDFISQSTMKSRGCGAVEFDIVAL